MGSFTPYGRKLMVDSLFVTGATIGNVWIALCAVVPGSVDDSSRLVEPKTGAYARAAYTGGWTSGTAGEVVSVGAVTFPVPSSNWGTLRGWAICNALTGGNVIAVGSLVIPKSVTLGMTAPVIPAGAMKASLR